MIDESEIIGTGNAGVVVATSPGVVCKYTTDKAEWQEEVHRLEFISQIDDPKFRKIVPQILGSSVGEWEIGEKKYQYCIEMKRVVGESIDQIDDPARLMAIGTNLGKTILELNSVLKPFTDDWSRKYGTQDMLLSHIIDDKSARVSREGTLTAKRYNTEATLYVLAQIEQAPSPIALTHLDLNLTNILVSDNNEITGIVDWQSLGLTNIDISLYQIATKPYVWPNFMRSFINQGGALNEGLVYAAGVIHVAWAPLIMRELGRIFDEAVIRQELETIHKLFSPYIDEDTSI